MFVESADVERIGLHLYGKEKLMVSAEPVHVDYKGQTVKARKLTVGSEIPINIDLAWENIKSPELLQFVARGMIAFRSTNGGFPKRWEKGETYGTTMRIFGFIPFGGTHYLFVEEIDDERYRISTREWDNRAKVWNHDVVMKDLGNDSIYYEDTITIYAGIWTDLVTAFAVIFYRHRHKRWKIIAEENLRFGK
jgi:hypothetical protein